MILTESEKAKGIRNGLHESDPVKAVVTSSLSSPARDPLAIQLRTDKAASSMINVSFMPEQGYSEKLQDSFFESDDEHAII